MARQDIKAGGAYIELFVSDNRLVRGLVSAKRRLDDWGRGAVEAGRRLMMVGGAMAAPMAKSVMTYADFKDQMAMVGAVSGATEAQLAALTDQAKLLGRTTSNTASEVAALQTELGRAGFNPKEIQEATPHVQNLARATGTDLAEAAAIAGASLRGFSMDTSETVRVADVMAATANGSSQTLTDLGEAMKMVAPIAAETGASIEDTAAAIGILANNGIKGTMAGTALARAYKNLSADKTAATMREIGVEAADSAGNLRPLSDIIADIGAATAGMGSAQRLAIFEKLFGRGQAAALKLASAEGAEAFGNLRSQLEQSAGTAAETSEKMDNTLGGFFRRVMSGVEGVQIAIGEALEDPLRGQESRLLDALGSITEWIEDNRDLVVTAGKWAIGITAVGAALVGLGLAAKAAAVVIGGLAMVLSVVTSPIGLITAALVAGTAAWFKYTESGQAALDTLKRVFGGIKDAISAGDWQLAGQIAMKGLQVVFLEGLTAIASSVDGVLGDTIGTIGAQIAGGDFAGAWATAVSGMGAIWDQWSAGVISVATETTAAVVRKWKDAVQSIANWMLRQSAQGGAMGAIVSKVLGVDMAEEEAKSSLREMARRRTDVSNTRWAIGEQQKSLDVAKSTGNEERVVTITDALARNLAKLADLEAGGTGVIQGEYASADLWKQLVGVEAEARQLERDANLAGNAERAGERRAFAEQLREEIANVAVTGRRSDLLGEALDSVDRQLGGLEQAILDKLEEVDQAAKAKAAASKENLANRVEGGATRAETELARLKQELELLRTDAGILAQKKNAGTGTGDEGGEGAGDEGGEGGKGKGLPGPGAGGMPDMTQLGESVTGSFSAAAFQAMGRGGRNSEDEIAKNTRLAVLRLDRSLIEMRRTNRKLEALALKYTG